MFHIILYLFYSLWWVICIIVPLIHYWNAFVHNLLYIYTWSVLITKQNKHQHRHFNGHSKPLLLSSFERKDDWGNKWKLATVLFWTPLTNCMNKNCKTFKISCVPQKEETHTGLEWHCLAWNHTHRRMSNWCVGYAINDISLGHPTTISLMPLEFHPTVLKPCFHLWKEIKSYSSWHWMRSIKALVQHYL